jgi:class 3 adenylate cyclase/basic membrane lipoprotein Med (substrate-binding protein (PBP1-ABC) superfamily)
MNNTPFVCAATLPPPPNASAAAARTNITTCYMLFGPLTDLGYTYAHNLGRITSHKALSERFPGTEIVSVSQPGAFFMNHTTVIAGMIQRGCAVIHATAPGFTDSIRPFVLAFPNVTFTVQNGWFQMPYAPNVVNYAARSYQPWFVAGRTAGKEARRRVGFLAAWVNVAEVLSAVNAFIAGVAAENPALLPVHVLSTESWYDPDRERVAVAALHELADCDVVAQYTDSFVAAEYANSRDNGDVMMSVQMHGVATRFYGDAVLTCVYSDWSSVYEEIDAALIQGRVPPRNYIFSERVAQLCDVSSRAAPATIRFANAYDVSSAPVFSGMSDAQIRNMTTPAAGASVVHESMPDPTVFCTYGTFIAYVRDDSNASFVLRPRCQQCPENTESTAGRFVCTPCPKGLVASPGSARCTVPPQQSADVGAIVGGVVAAVVAAGGILGALVLVQSKRMASAVRDTSNAPRQSPCALLFTDIEASTGLWCDEPDAMSDALDVHNAIIRAAIKAHGAYEVKTAGDSFMVACNDAKTAALVAIEVQTKVLANRWPAELRHPVRVRIGFAYGPCDVVFDEHSKGYDYYGSTVNLAARCETAGDGGQVFMPCGTMSDADVVAIGCSLSAPFDRHLRGIEHPVPLVELVIPETTVAYRNARNAAPRKYSCATEGGNGGTDSASDAGSSVSSAVAIDDDEERTIEALRHPLVVDGTLTPACFSAFRGVVAAVLQQALLQLPKDARKDTLKQLQKATDTAYMTDATLIRSTGAVSSQLLANGRHANFTRSMHRAARCIELQQQRRGSTVHDPSVGSEEDVPRRKQPSFVKTPVVECNPHTPAVAPE